MKKFLGFIVALLLAFTISSCTNCSNPKVLDDQKPQTELVSYIALDNEYMNLEFGGNCCWYETDILLDEFLNEECDGSIQVLVNIYQTVESRDSVSFDTKVYKLQHFANGTNSKGYVHGFWIENLPLNIADIKISYNKAFELMNQVNLPKPHSQHVTLRKPIGPINCNPQWIFGNIHEQIWIDAVTGEARSSNPAFPETLKMPLGEWP